MTALQAFTLGRRHGLSPSRLHLLLSLIDDSPQTPFQLSISAHCSAANITGLCLKLESAGWVTRTRHHRDQRMWLISPTEKAFNLFTPALTEQTP